MAAKSGVEYCDSSINFLRGCAGCELWTRHVKTCYVGRMITRWAGTSKAWPEDFTKPILVEGQLDKVYRWPDLTNTERPQKPWLNQLPRVIFVNDMSDTFGRHIWQDGQKKPFYFNWLNNHMPSLATSPHAYLFLTKRPTRAVEFFAYNWGHVPANFLVGTSVTHESGLNRVEELVRLRHSNRGMLWLSIEPVYSYIDLRPFLPFIQWVALGGESGLGNKRNNLDYIMAIAQDVQAAGVPLFIKQLGSGMGYGKKGGDWQTWPQELRVRQMPHKLSRLISKETPFQKRMI